MTGAEGDTVQAGIASWTVRIGGRLLGGLLTAAALAEAADLYRAVGIVVFAEQRLLALLGLALGTLYILKPATPGAKRLNVPWFDALAAVAGLLVCAYLSWHYERIFEELYSRPRDALVGGAVILVLVAEGVRRTAGPVLFVFLLSFFTLGLMGHFIPGQFQGRDVDIDRLVIYLSLDSNALVGIPLTVATTIVIAFIYFGNLLDLSGGSRFFTDISTALMGRYRGGSAKIAVTASSIFGSISGSATSNVVSTGVITIPLMKKGGYPAHTAAAIEAVASTGGQLMPPMMGAAAFVMAEFLQISYQEVVLAALIPAILYYVALFIQADLYAARERIGRVDEASIPPRWPVFRAGWPYVVPFAVVILCLFRLNLRPETSALWASGSLVPIGLFIGYQGQRMSWTVIFTVLAKTGALCVQLLMISCMAGIIIGVLNITGLGFALTQAIIHLAGGTDRHDPGAGGADLHRSRHGHADPGRLPAAGDAGDPLHGRGRHPAHGGAPVRPLLRHAVADHAAGGGSGLHRRHRGRLGFHAHGIRRGPLRLDRLCGAVPVRAGAGTADAGFGTQDSSHLGHRHHRRLAGVGGFHGLFRKTPGHRPPGTLHCCRGAAVLPGRGGELRHLDGCGWRLSGRHSGRHGGIPGGAGLIGRPGNGVLRLRCATLRTNGLEPHLRSS